MRSWSQRDSIHTAEQQVVQYNWRALHVMFLIQIQIPEEEKLLTAYVACRSVLLKKSRLELFATTTLKD